MRAKVTARPRLRAPDRPILDYAVRTRAPPSGNILIPTDFMTPPEHKFMVGVRYDPTEDLFLNAHLYYVDAVKTVDPVNPFIARNLDPYFRLDLRAEHDLWDDRASLAVGVRNLLDKSHPEGATQFLNDAETERMIYAEFSISFK